PLPMAIVELTQKKTTLVDDDDHERASQHHWYASRCGDRWTARTTMEGRKVYLHRWLLDAPAGVMVDQRNGDTLYSRRSVNLRFATNQQNQRNQVHVRGRSRYKGVAWHCRRRQW